MSFLGLGSLKLPVSPDSIPDDPAFPRWFKRSVVAKYRRDGSLEGPIRVFHGSRDVFEVFDPPQRADGRQPWNAFGAWFTEDQIYAKKLTQKPDSSDRGPVYEVYLSIQNPMKLTGNGPRGWQKLVEMYEKVTGAKTPDATKAGNDLFRQHLKNLGYDGIVLSNFTGDEALSPYAQNFYIALDPSQIKSVRNSGTWNPDSPNIFQGWTRRSGRR